MDDEDSNPLGPVDLAVVLFAGEIDQSGIRAAVASAVTGGAVRVLDVLLVRKDLNGAVTLHDAESPASAAELLGFPTSLPDLIGEEDAAAVAAEMDAGTTVLMIAWENVWAAQIATAIRDRDGQVLTLQRLPRADVEAVVQAQQKMTKESS